MWAGRQLNGMARHCPTLASLAWTALVAACLVLPATAVPMTWNSVTTIDPLAVCNDGSPAGYYFRAGTNEGVDKCVP